MHVRLSLNYNNYRNYVSLVLHFFNRSKEFRSEYGRLHELRALIPHGTPYVACTTTATRSIKEEIISNLEMHACATVMTSPDRANIYYEVLSRTEISKDLQFLIE